MDLPHLLCAISEASPCGDDLEYDPQLLELQRAAEGQPERRMGDAVLAAEPPDWRKTREIAGALFARGKDLRIAHYLVRSALALDGLPGLAEGLALVRELLGRYWDDLYPRLDHEDRDDPTLRLNSLAELAGEPLLRLLRDAPLLHSRAFGPLSLRAALQAAGLSPGSAEGLGREQLAGALQDSDPQRLAGDRAALEKARAALAGIEAEVAGHLGAGAGPDLGALARLLRQAGQLLAEPAPHDVDGEEPDTEQDGRPAAAEPERPGRGAVPIASRDEVLHSLDRILGYYRQHEPSSPVPVLLARAKSLVNADFAEIVRNLIPDGLAQFEKLQGPGGD